MRVKKSDVPSWGSAVAITPASNTAIAEQTALLFDAAGTVTVRFALGGAQIVLPVAAGIPLRLRVFSVDAIATATTVHGLL